MIRIKKKKPTRMKQVQELGSGDTFVVVGDGEEAVRQIIWAADPQFLACPASVVTVVCLESGEVERLPKGTCVCPVKITASMEYMEERAGR